MMLAVAGAAVISSSVPASAATFYPGTVRTESAAMADGAPASFQGPGTYVLRNAATNLCLDDSTRYGLRTFPCNSASVNNGYQAWDFSLPEPLYYALQNVATGLCLDYSQEYGVRGFGCDGNSYGLGYQGWYVGARAGDPALNDVELENVYGAAGICLDDSAQYGLRGFPCNQASYDNGYQKWVLTDLTI